MQNDLIELKNDVTKVFNIGIAVLKGARALQTISQDLKLLAFNGIVQAARIGNKQGQSLITLSGFLSDLPSQISPDLEELEELASELSSIITLASITVRKFMIYSITLMGLLKQINADTKNKIALERIRFSRTATMGKILKEQAVKDSNEIQKLNVALLAHKSEKLSEKLARELGEAQSIIKSAEKEIERIRRNGFIANYMGSNIAIESAYLEGKQTDFSGLINNIKNIAERLDNSLDSMLEKLNEGSSILQNIKKKSL